MNDLLPYFKWFDTTWVHRVINDSNWLFPAIEAVHIVALAMLLGAILMLNLRILGITMKSRPVAKLKNDLAPWTLTSLIVILVTGFLLFTSEATRSFFSGPFRIKMVLLVSAILFHYTLQRWLIGSERVYPVVAKLSAMIALVLWFGVGFAGRAIGFF